MNQNLYDPDPLKCVESLCFRSDDGQYIYFFVVTFYRTDKYCGRFSCKYCGVITDEQQWITHTCMFEQLLIYMSALELSLYIGFMNEKALRVPSVRDCMKKADTVISFEWIRLIYFNTLSDCALRLLNWLIINEY